MFGLLAILGLAAAPAQADPIIDFGTGNAVNIGTVSYTGGLAPLVGTNIGLGSVGGIGTPLNSSPPGYSVTGTNSGFGSLDFTTGAYQSYNAGTYTFGSGGTFTIKGSILAAGINSVTTLFTGTFTSATFSQGGIGVYQLKGVQTATPVNANLLAFFGLSGVSDFTFNVFGIAAFGSNLPNGGFTDNTFSTDAALPVPEPASLLLLGSGLTALGAYIRRRNLKQNRKPTTTSHG